MTTTIDDEDDDGMDTGAKSDDGEAEGAGEVTSKSVTMRSVVSGTLKRKAIESDTITEKDNVVELEIRHRVAKICRRTMLLDDSLRALAMKRARETATTIISLEIHAHDIDKKEPVHGTEALSFAFFCPTIGRTELSLTIPPIPHVVRDYVISNNVTISASLSVQLYWPRPPTFTFGGVAIPAATSKARQFTIRNVVEESCWTFNFKTTARGMLNEISFIHDSAEHKLITAKMIQIAAENEYHRLETLATMRSFE